MNRIRIILCSAASIVGCASDPGPTTTTASVSLDSLSQHAQLRFHAADTNHDGVITADEVARFYAARASHRFDRLDVGHSGALQVAALPARDRATLANADRNGDGVITRAEFTAAHNARWFARLHAADTNGDGALTADEVGPVSWVRVQTADADGDGKVTFAELRNKFGNHE
jgi:Ca2+-binding EF-hand superfamily protein